MNNESVIEAPIEEPKEENKPEVEPEVENEPKVYTETGENPTNVEDEKLKEAVRRQALGLFFIIFWLFFSKLQICLFFSFFIRWGTSIRTKLHQF